MALTEARSLRTPALEGGGPVRGPGRRLRVRAREPQRKGGAMPRSRAWWRILDTPPTATPGTCGRCGGRAWQGRYRWWHQTGCVDRSPGAEFVPDRPQPAR